MSDLDKFRVASLNDERKELPETKHVSGADQFDTYDGDDWGWLDDDSE